VPGRLLLLLLVKATVAVTTPGEGAAGSLTLKLHMVVAPCVANNVEEQSAKDTSLCCPPTVTVMVLMVRAEPPVLVTATLPAT